MDGVACSSLPTYVLGSEGPKGATCTSGLAASGTCMTCKTSVPMPTSKVA